MTENSGLILRRNNFAILSDAGGDMAEAMRAMQESGMTLRPQDLLRIKTPSGGGTRWQVGDVLEKELVGAFIHFQACSILWPSEDAKEGQMPVLKSFDGIEGERVGPMTQEMAEKIEPWRIDGEPFNGKHYNVSEASGFPYAQWDTGKNGRGKRMKDQRMVFLLRPEDPAPMLVLVQPGSLKVFDKWFKEIPLREKLPWYRLVIGLSLVEDKNADGTKFSRIVPRTAGHLDKETSLALQDTWGNVLRQAAKSIDTEGTNG